MQYVGALHAMLQWKSYNLLTPYSPEDIVWPGGGESEDADQLEVGPAVEHLVLGAHYLRIRRCNYIGQFGQSSDRIQIL